MFLGIYGIDEYVNIPAVTHRFSSGAAYAPTAISYSIYEEGNATGIDEDVDMTPASPFDSVVGLYYARRQLTSAAGFEVNKTYVAVVKATVDGVSALDVHVFQVRAIAPTAVEVADAILKRDMSSVTGEAARSMLNALRFLRNKWVITGTTLSVKKEDDATEAWSASLTTNASAEPVTGSDPG